MKRHGIARGIADVNGLIPGRVNPKVADDVTINAKKGEYEIPQDVVAHLGPRFFDALVAKSRKETGTPQGTGPKSHMQPDNMGRMDKPGLKRSIAGMADGGILDFGGYPADDPRNNVGKGIVSDTAAAGVGSIADAANNYQPIELKPIEAPVRENAPWTIQEGANQTRQNFIPAIADRIGSALGFHDTPDQISSATNTAKTITAAPSAPSTAPAPITQIDRVPLDWTKAANDAMTAVKGFNQPQPAQPSMEERGLIRSADGQSWVQSPALQQGLTDNANKIGRAKSIADLERIVRDPNTPLVSGNQKSMAIEGLKALQGQSATNIAQQNADANTKHVDAGIASNDFLNPTIATKNLADAAMLQAKMKSLLTPATTKGSSPDWAGISKSSLEALKMIDARAAMGELSVEDKQLRKNYLDTFNLAHTRQQKTSYTPRQSAQDQGEE